MSKSIHLNVKPLALATGSREDKVLVLGMIIDLDVNSIVWVPWDFGALIKYIYHVHYHPTPIRSKPRQVAK